MMIKKVFLLGVFIFIFAGQSLFAQSDAFLDNLIRQAIDNNLQVKQLRKQWESRKARVLSAKTLPQPSIGFTHYGESIQTKTGPMKKKYTIQQPIPFPTKLSLRGKIAKKEAEIAYARYILGVRGVIEELKFYFYDYYFIRQSINVLREEKLILENVHKSIQRKYETLKVAQQDFVKIDLEISKIDDRILNLGRQENLIGAQINRIIDQPQGEEIAVLLGYKLNIKYLKISKGALLEMALKESPHILLDKLGLERQSHKLSLAKQGYIPDFSIMAEYIDIGEGTTNSSNDGENAWMIGVSVRVPLWFWKIRSDVKSAKLKRDAEEYKFQDKRSFLSFKIEDLFFQLTTQEQLIDLYGNVILPQAEHNFSVSRTAYEDGSVDFLNWLDAERNLIAIKIAKLKQEVDYKKIIAQIEYIVGEDLE